VRGTTLIYRGEETSAPSFSISVLLTRGGHPPTTENTFITRGTREAFLGNGSRQDLWVIRPARPRDPRKKKRVGPSEGGNPKSGMLFMEKGSGDLLFAPQWR